MSKSANKCKFRRASVSAAAADGDKCFSFIMIYDDVQWFLTVSVDFFFSFMMTCEWFNSMIELFRLMIDVDHLSPLDRVGRFARRSRRRRLSPRLVLATSRAPPLTFYRAKIAMPPLR